MNTYVTAASATTKRTLAVAATATLLVGAFAPAALADPGNSRGNANAGSANSRANDAHGKSDSHKKASKLSLRSVDLKRHSPINVFSAATVRPLQVRATVADHKTGGTQKVSVSVTLDQYTGKRGTPTTTPALTWASDATGAAVKTVALDTVVVKRNDARYSGSYTFPVGAVAPGQTAVVCLAGATVTPVAGQTATATIGHKAAKKLNAGDCVRVINVDPATVRAPRNHA